MNFSDYQNQTKKTAIYPHQGENLAYPALGLNGEAGEVAEKIKKIIRDDNGILSESARQDLILELGDVLWYLAAISCELNIDLDVVAQKNLEKLRSRKARGTLTGSGDHR
jgi:NTP pyrophosphatase (non-canonical NTP hydrolase)